jgi:Xaa-Pro dipeptidase
MLNEARQRTASLQSQMRAKNIPLAIFTDESSIAYLAGFWGYLGVEFGRPTMLLVPAEAPPTIITPLMETEMVGAMTWVEQIISWEDSGQRSWHRLLGAEICALLGDSPAEIWIEKTTYQPLSETTLTKHSAAPPWPISLPYWAPCE